jgi:hypothetical protein
VPVLSGVSFIVVVMFGGLASVKPDMIVMASGDYKARSLRSMLSALGGIGASGHDMGVLHKRS